MADIQSATANEIRRGKKEEVTTGQKYNGLPYGMSALFHRATITRHRASTSMYSLTFFAFALCCHSNATRAPIANPPNSAQLGASPTAPPSYIRVRAIV